MKKCKGIFVAALGVSLLAWLLIWIELGSSPPMLEFQGYDKSPTNDNRYAKLLLHNTTKRNIWIILQGEEYPLQPTFLKKPKIETSASTNVPSVRAVLH